MRASTQVAQTLTRCAQLARQTAAGASNKARVRGFAWQMHGVASCLLCCVAWLWPTALMAMDFDHQVPLATSPGGSFYVSSSVAGIEAEFLVDTGAGFVTVSDTLFRALRAESAVREVRRVAARLANGKLKPVTVYVVEHFVIGAGCDVGPVEVAVIAGAGRNLLGLSALTRAAPFAIHTSPPALVLSDCKGGPAVAARD